MSIQLRNPVQLIRLTSQLNTLAPELAQFRNARSEKAALKPTAKYGTPERVHRLNTFGAVPNTAMEYSERLAMYRNAFPADQADNKMTALMTESKPLMPAFWKHVSMLHAVRNGSFLPSLPRPKAKRRRRSRHRGA